MSCPSYPHNRDIDHHANVLQPSRQEVQLWELNCLPTDLHLCSCTNYCDHALQIGLEVVVGVGAKNATAADLVLEHANTPNNILVPTQNRKHYREKNFHHQTTSQRKHHRSTLEPKLGQSADEEHVVTTAAVATGEFLWS